MTYEEYLKTIDNGLITCIECGEKFNSRGFSRHLLQVHKLSKEEYIRKHVQWSSNCSICKLPKNINNVSFNGFYINNKSIDCKECVEDLARSKEPVGLTHCIECGEKLKHGTKFCSRSCANVFRYRDSKYLEKFRRSIKNSYTDELRNKRRLSALNNMQFTRSNSITNKAPYYFINRLPKNFTIFSISTLDSKSEFNHKKKVVMDYLGSLKGIQSSYEIELAYILAKSNIKFKVQHIIEGFRFKYDFFIPKDNLLIEVSPEYYHNDLEVLHRDEVKREVAILSGFNYVRLEDRDLSVELEYARIKDMSMLWSNLNLYNNLDEIENEYRGNPHSSPFEKHWKYNSKFPSEKVFSLLSNNKYGSVSELMKNEGFSYKIIQRTARELGYSSDTELLRATGNEN